MSKERLSKGPLRRRKPRSEIDEDDIRPLAEIRGEIESLVVTMSRVETTGNGGGLENWETRGRIQELAERLPRAEKARVLQRIEDIE